MGWADMATIVPIAERAALAAIRADGEDPWAARAEALGAGEILLTSMDRDGTKDGYDIDLLRAVNEVITVPLVASGGAGTLDHFSAAITEGGADAVLAASLFHFGQLRVAEVKEHMAQAGIPVRR